jgi:hypothetical protein
MVTRAFGTVVALAFGSAALAVGAQRTINYVPATFDQATATAVPGTVAGGNTSAWPPGGLAFTDTLTNTDNLWALQPFGSGYVAQADSATNAPPLQTIISGLAPGQLYRLYVFFLMTNSDASGLSNCWIQAGLTLDALRTFYGDYACRCRDSGFSWSGALPDDTTNSSSSAVFVGAARAPADGELAVYVCNQTNSPGWQTVYLGVGYEAVPTEGPPYPATLVFHVATTGSDSAPGTPSRPWRTLSGARDRLRALRAGTFEPAIVWVHQGIYPLDQTLAFDQRDSWTTYRAVSNSTVRLIGGIQYTGSLMQVTDPLVLGRLLTPEATNHLYQLDLPAAGVTNYGTIVPRGYGRDLLPQQVEVYIDGHRLFMGQYPNPGQTGIPIGNVLDPGSILKYGGNSRGGLFQFSSSRVASWAGISNVWIKGYFNWGWADDLVPLAAIDPVAMTLQTALPTYYGFAPNTGPGYDYRRFFGVNLLEEIDVPGEYWLDRSSGRLYLYPPDGSDPAAVQVGITVLEQPLIAITNACHLLFDGIDLGLSRGMGLQIYGGDHCGIRNAEISQLGNHAVMINSSSDPETTLFDAGHDHAVASCRVHDCGSGGVLLGGGLTAAFAPGRNRVENCEIYDVNRHEQTYRGAVDFSGLGNLVQNSLIHNMPQMAVLGYGSMQRIEYNEFQKVFFCDGNDSGAIYQGNTPIGWNTICNNLFYDVANAGPFALDSWGVYLDGGYYGASVQGNVFVRSGKVDAVFLAGGSMNQCTDNVFVDCPCSFRTDDRLETSDPAPIQPGGAFDQLLTSVNYQNPPWSLRCPELVSFWEQTPGSPYNTLARNLCVRSGVFSIPTNWWSGTPDTPLDDPGFVQGLRLLPGCAAYQQVPNFNPGDVFTMGVRLCLSELRVRDWNAALRKTGYLGPLDPGLTRDQLVALWADPVRGRQFVHDFLFPAKDPDGLAPTPSGFALRLQRPAGTNTDFTTGLSTPDGFMILATNPNSDNFWQNATPGTEGYSFTTGSELSACRKLGISAFGNAGLANSHVVTLFDANGAILTSATIPSGEQGTNSVWHWCDIAPIILLTNTQYILAASYAGNDPDHFWFPTATLPPGYTLGNSLYGSGSAQAFPDQVYTTGGEGFFGPNLALAKVDLVQIRVNADAVPLVGLRLEESDDLQVWRASSLLLDRQWDDNLDGFETFEAALPDLSAAPHRFYRVVFTPLW